MEENANTQVAEDVAEDHQSTEGTGEQLLIEAVENSEYNAEAHFSFLEIRSDEESDDRSVTMNLGSANGKNIPKTWILLDNESTVDVFTNPKLLCNMRQEEGTLHIHTQAGTTVTNWKGNLPGYGMVWYCKNGIANILSLAHVKDRYQVTFDSANRNEFIV